MNIEFRALLDVVTHKHNSIHFIKLLRGGDFQFYIFHYIGSSLGASSSLFVCVCLFLRLFLSVFFSFSVSVSVRFECVHRITMDAMATLHIHDKLVLLYTLISFQLELSTSFVFIITCCYSAVAAAASVGCMFRPMLLKREFRRLVHAHASNKSAVHFTILTMMSCRHHQMLTHANQFCFTVRPKHHDPQVWTVSRCRLQPTSQSIRYGLSATTLIQTKNETIKTAFQ